MRTRITCPGCQAALTLSSNFAGKPVRCPRCMIVFSAADVQAVADASEAITAQRDAARNPRSPSTNTPSLGSQGASPEARIQLRCQRCGNEVSFPAVDMGTVQECPECREYIDVPDLTDEAKPVRVPGWDIDPYERQLRETDRQLEHVDRQLEQRDRMDQKIEVMLGQIAQLIGRCELLAERFDRVLARWEQQGRSDPA